MVDAVSKEVYEVVLSEMVFKSLNLGVFGYNDQEVEVVGGELWAVEKRGVAEQVVD